MQNIRERKRDIYFIWNDVKNLTYILPPLISVIWQGSAKIAFYSHISKQNNTFSKTFFSLMRVIDTYRTKENKWKHLGWLEKIQLISDQHWAIVKYFLLKSFCIYKVYLSFFVIQFRLWNKIIWYKLLHFYLI